MAPGSVVFANVANVAPHPALSSIRDPVYQSMPVVVESSVPVSPSSFLCFDLAVMDSWWNLESLGDTRHSLRTPEEMTSCSLPVAEGNSVTSTPAVPWMESLYNQVQYHLDIAHMKPLGDLSLCFADLS